MILLALALAVAAALSLARLGNPRSIGYLGSIYDDLGHGVMNAVMALMFVSGSLMSSLGSGWALACLALALGVIALAASVHGFRERLHLSVLIGPWVTLIQAGVMAYSMSGSSGSSTMSAMPGMDMSGGMAFPGLAWLLITLLAIDALATSLVAVPTLTRLIPETGGRVMPLSVAYPHAIMDVALIAMLALAL